MGNTNSVKHVILVRKDLRLRRAEVASLVSRATARFFLDNDESEENEELRIKLSSIEADWISQGAGVVVLGVPSQGALDSLLFRAEAAGIPYHTVSHRRKLDEKSEGEDVVIACVALGPDYSDSLDPITGKLKLF
jgi:peptidyl-tRNA hydrolase